MEQNLPTTWPTVVRWSDPPGEPKIIGYEEGMKLKEGDILRLKCLSLGGYPQPSIKWIKITPAPTQRAGGSTADEKEISGLESETGNSVGVSSEIYIRLTASDHLAIYKCLVVNEVVPSPLVTYVKLNPVYFSSESVKLSPKDLIRVRASSSPAGATYDRQDLTADRGSMDGNSLQKHHHHTIPHHQSLSTSSLRDSPSPPSSSSKMISTDTGSPDRDAEADVIEVSCESGECNPYCNLTWFQNGIRIDEDIIDGHHLKSRRHQSVGLTFEGSSDKAFRSKVNISRVPGENGGENSISRLALRKKKWTSSEDGSSLACVSTNAFIPNKRSAKNITIHVLCEYHPDIISGDVLIADCECWILFTVIK